jgi:glycosyltransferase involved in cell wall biosynthesis
MQAFLESVSALGERPALVYVPQPGLDRERRAAADRIDTLRLARGSRRLVPELERADRVWAVTTLAHHAYATTLADRPYRCWLGTSLADEESGRLPDLTLSRRVAARVNRPALAHFERRVLEEAEAVYATSPASRAALAATGGRNDSRIGLLPLPVDSGHFTPEADDVWLRHLDRPTIGFVGRIDDPRKNIALLLEAFALVRHRLPAATLRLIGPAAPRSPIPGVELLGRVPDVAEPLRSCSLMVVPSRQEGFGIAAAEALAAGVPVVATPCRGPEDLLRRSGGGVILDGWSPEELSARLLALLQDEATLVEMRRRGRDYVLREHSPARLRELLSTALA